MPISPLQFSLFGTVLTVVLFLIQKAFQSWRQKRHFKAAIFVVFAFGMVVFGAIAFFVGTPPPTLAQTKWYQESPAVEVILFLMMLVGMASSYLTKQIEDRRAKVQEKRKVGDISWTPLTFDVWEFMYPMLVSVITFGAILQGVGEKPLDVQAVILSFQTGFFGKQFWLEVCRSNSDYSIRSALSLMTKRPSPTRRRCSRR